MALLSMHAGDEQAGRPSIAVKGGNRPASVNATSKTPRS
jgi:hypothetical protein